MAKNLFQGKRGRAIAALTFTLCASLSLGALSACGGETETEEPEENPSTTPAASTDTQLLRNGNFEFYSEMNVEKKDDRRNFINTPTSWSFTSGSPASDSASGIIDVSADAWTYLAKEGSAFTSVDDAFARWNDENVTLYDRLKFKSDFSKEIDALASDSEAKKLFSKYSYTIDYDDVKDLNSDLPDGVSTHEDATGTSVLMIHNNRTSDGVRGTGQKYTSSTTITLDAGTAAEVSLWVMTDKLSHWYTTNPEELERYGGAYISVTNTLGGNQQDEMRIVNINTKGEWKKYTLYIRANDYSTTTFRLVLGLGRNTSSDNRLEAVNGYAFFDDVVCKKIGEKEYAEATNGLSYKCSILSSAKEKVFDMDKIGGTAGSDTFALDLYGEAAFRPFSVDAAEIDLTKETSGRNEYVSKVPDNTDDPDTPSEKKSIAEVTTYQSLATRSQSGNAGYNGYLDPIFKNDFEDKFPFYTQSGDPITSQPVLLLLSTNGAAYTAKVSDTAFTLTPENPRMLVSFYVKTSSILSGMTGAGITLVDGENRSSISPFDSTTVKGIDIDDTQKDILKGWVRCFFIVSNDTDEAKSFSLEFTYGPTAIADSTLDEYSDGYAAFTGFEYTYLTEEQLAYASTGTYAVKTTLTGSVKDDTVFAEAEPAGPKIEEGLAIPMGFEGVVAGSTAYVPGGVPNSRPETVYTGLLNEDYREAYFGLDDTENPWKKAIGNISDATSADDWWNGAFGDTEIPTKVARQPLVIMNTGAATRPFGFVSSALQTTLTSNSSRRISMRVKVQRDTTAYLYLTDTSDLRNGYNTRLQPTLPTYTYWYDDDGNILRCDPSSENFKRREDTLFYLEENGLYTRANANDGVYYANLKNFKTDENGNLVDDDNVIVYYAFDGDFYAYREKDGDTYKYSQVVEQLPDEVDGASILRYPSYSTFNASAYEAVIAVKGSEATENSWVDVSFYINTGSKAKTYRLELWAGPREAESDTELATAFPENGYVFFDCYSSTSVSNFSTLRDGAEDFLLETEANRDAGNSDKLNDGLALYYTFTFFDSSAYHRYDATQDAEQLGNPWGSYEQSSYSEGIAWLRHDDPTGAYTGTPSYSLYLDYSVNEVAVVADDLSPDTGDDTQPEEASSTPINWWTLASSLALAVVLLAVIGILVGRKVVSHLRKTGKIKPAKEKKAKPARKRRKSKAEPQVSEPEEEPEAPQPEEDPDDPYNN